MQYENLFWSMACIVALALLGGALCGRLKVIKRVLTGVLCLSLALFLLVFFSSRAGGYSDLAFMLSIAAFMFFLVIATAASLLTRRILLGKN